MYTAPFSTFRANRSFTLLYSYFLNIFIIHFVPKLCLKLIVAAYPVLNIFLYTCVMGSVVLVQLIIMNSQRIFILGCFWKSFCRLLHICTFAKYTDRRLWNTVNHLWSVNLMASLRSNCHLTNQRRIVVKSLIVSTIGFWILTSRVFS